MHEIIATLDQPIAETEDLSAFSASLRDQSDNFSAHTRHDQPIEAAEDLSARKEILRTASFPRALPLRERIQQSDTKRRRKRMAAVSLRLLTGILAEPAYPVTSLFGRTAYLILRRSLNRTAQARIRKRPNLQPYTTEVPKLTCGSRSIRIGQAGGIAASEHIRAPGTPYFPQKSVLGNIDADQGRGKCERPREHKNRSRKKQIPASALKYPKSASTARTARAVLAVDATPRGTRQKAPEIRSRQALSKR